MRKKLLALLMCATMVLGTGVTAFADDTQDTVDKITKNYSKFDKEVVANGVNSTVKDEVTYVAKDSKGNVVVKTVKVAYNADTQEPVVLNKDGKPATYVEDKLTVNEVVNQSVATTAVAAAAAAGKNTAAVTVKTLTGNQEVTFLVKDSKATKAELMDGINYVETVDDAIKTISANDKILASTDLNFGKVWATVSKSDDAAAMQPALYEAVKNGTLSENAFLAKFTAFVQETGDVKTADIKGVTDKNGDAVKAAKLYFYGEDFSNFMGGTFTLDADLFSQSTLKKASNITVYKYAGYESEYSSLLKQPVKGLLEVGTAEIGKTFSFENLKSLSGTFVFDQAADATNNDGVADTTTTAAAANNSASPKTGDVAPIAALAVVMMGACGAMVVASKKRA